MTGLLLPCQLLPLVLALVAMAHGGEQCHCTECPAAPSPNTSHFTLIVSPWRDAKTSSPVYTPYHSYRVMLKAEKPFDLFSVCATGGEDKGEEMSGRFLKRFLPLHASRREQCDNIVEQHTRLQPRTVGEIHLRWRAPNSNSSCIDFRVCVKKSSIGQAEHVQKMARLCFSDYIPLSVVTKPYSHNNFQPDGLVTAANISYRPSLTTRLLASNGHVVAVDSQIYTPGRSYRVELNSDVAFRDCFISVTYVVGYGGVDDSGRFTHKHMTGPEKRVEGYPNVVSCHNFHQLRRKTASVVWMAPGNQSTCVEFRVWVEYTTGEAVTTTRRLCRTPRVSVCPNRREDMFTDSQPPRVSRGGSFTSFLVLRRWEPLVSAWLPQEDPLVFKPNSDYQVTFQGGRDVSGVICYVITKAVPSTVSRDESGHFTNKPFDGPEHCYNNHPNILSCHGNQNGLVNVQWRSPTEKSSCVSFMLWLGSSNDSMKMSSHQLCRLVFVPFDPTTRADNAMSSYLPLDLPVDEPGPLFDTTTHTLTIQKWSLDSGVEHTLANYYMSSSLYIVRLSTTKPFYRCFMAAIAQPDSLTNSAAGMFERRHRTGLEDRYQGYSNVVSCGEEDSERNTSAVIWMSPDNESVCVEFTLWLEHERGILTKVARPLCRMQYRVKEDACPDYDHSTESCLQCSLDSPYYVHRTLSSSPPRCCGGLPYDPRKTQCCAETIQPGSANTGHGCCGGNRYFSFSESTCCHGNKQQGASSQYSCCDRRSFNPADFTSRRGRVLCCLSGSSSKAFNSEEKICCYGQLFDVPPGQSSSDMTCCRNPTRALNKATHQCMICRGATTSVVQPRHIPMGCCGSKAYNLTEKACCDVGTESLADRATRGCCGLMAYDKRSQRCCSGRVVEAPLGISLLVNTPWQCCGDRLYDTNQHNCLSCRGDSVITPRMFQCCGAQQFNKLTSACCNGNILPLPQAHNRLEDLPPYSCCGQVVYNTNTNTCCSAQDSAIAPGRLIIGTHVCCGLHRIYNRHTHTCQFCRHGNGEPGPHLALRRDGLLRCCGAVVFDAARQTCCRDGVVINNPSTC